MREYSLDGRPDVFDDGIPENWQLPSTPTNWYVPQGRDYYDVEANGPGVYKAGLMSLQDRALAACKPAPQPASKPAPQPASQRESPLGGGAPKPASLKGVRESPNWS
jgi:hypothetical protein